MLFVFISLFLFTSVLSLLFFVHGKFETARVMKECAKCGSDIQPDSTRHWYTLDDRDVAICDGCQQQGGLVY